MQTETNQSKVEVTEDDLVKSITDLESKVTPAKEEPATTVKSEPLAKSIETIKTNASENLKKALDVSEVLDEAVALLGTHVDRSLEAMQKSIQSAADRDVAIARVLTDLKKSIDANTEALNKMSDTPAGAASTRPVTTKTGEILTKSTTVKEDEIVVKDPNVLRKSILDGLSNLSTSAKDSGDRQRYSHALIKFESTGDISDADMKAALKD